VKLKRKRKRLVVATGNQQFLVGVESGEISAA
jgi:hypothetical protein